jgi:alkanesulfonate monooxygenase SsuD/methylene tetrahydromethanopterin reductase-like flavin-dependent oxidoreductase (luciferase family)
MAAAEEAERLGFGSVCGPVSIIAADDYARSLLTLPAAMAAGTSRIQIGTAVVLASATGAPSARRVNQPVGWTGAHTGGDARLG